MELFETARQMVDDAQRAVTAERILKELLPVAQSGQLRLDDAMTQMTLAELYSCFGAVYKTLRQWEKGLHYDQESRDIYKKIYETAPSADVFRKYCNKVYNIANITEAWAMTEKTNPELWEKTRQAYEDVYAIETMNLAAGASERRMVKAASTILSLGTALINTGKHEDGMKKYREGIALILDLAKNNRAMDLYAELCLHLLECTYQLVQCGKLTVAYELSKDIGNYLTTVIQSGEEAAIAKVMEHCNAFFSQMNQVLSRLLSVETAQEHLIVAKLASELYGAVLPVASPMHKANLIITKCNMCSIVMFGMHDYEQAYQEYKHLLELTVKEDLAVPDKNGKYIDAVNSRLVEAYSRILLCLEKMERHEEAKLWIDDANKWAKYFSEHLEADRGDVPKVLFDIHCSLKRNGSALSLLFFMMAFHAMAEDGYDKNAHPKTVMRILLAFKQLQGGEDT